MQQLMYRIINIMLTFRITVMIVHKVLYCVQVAISTGQREWVVTSLVDCTCACTGVLSDAAIDLPYNFTFRITVMIVHKVLDCVQVTISTGQRERGVTSLVDCTCACTGVLSDAAIDTV